MWVSKMLLSSFYKETLIKERERERERERESRKRNGGIILSVHNELQEF